MPFQVLCEQGLVTEIGKKGGPPGPPLNLLDGKDLLGRDGLHAGVEPGLVAAGGNLVQGALLDALVHDRGGAVLRADLAAALSPVAMASRRARRELRRRDLLARMLVATPKCGLEYLRPES